MAELRVTHPLTLIRAKPSVNVIKKEGQVDIIELKFHEIVLRLTELELKYIIEEVSNARTDGRTGSGVSGV